MLKRLTALLMATLMLCTLMPMVSAEDSYNDTTLGWEEHTTHVYDSACDRSCNVCGALRQVNPHVYDSACDADCNVCGTVREVGDHVYDHACDTTCNVVGCGHVRTVGDHVYDNACDTTCNVVGCGHVRTVGDHVYDNACDANCNVCEAPRSVPDHVYDNGNDTACNVCGFLREACNHQWDNACDTLCNVEGCGYVRKVPDHVYDNACDVDCNVCGITRTVGDHVKDKDDCLDGNCIHCHTAMPATQPHNYDHDCDTACNVCGTARVTQHVYDHACDATCNVVGCGYVRKVPDHVYDNACDVSCNVVGCPYTREIQHKYDNNCDALCNVEGCGHTRTVPDHIYDHNCDTTCNECGAIRTVPDHVYDNACDTDCNACGLIREVGDHVWAGGFCDLCGIASPNKVEITSQPATAAYAKEGAKVSVKITAEGDGLKYTWYIKNSGSSKYSKSSITKSTYSATMSDKVKGRRIYCVVSDEYGNTVKSKTFVLRESVSITSQSATARYAKKGAKVSAKVTASGDGLKYTWYIKNAGKSTYTKSSVTSSTYSATMSSKVKGRKVYCIVKDKYGKKVQSKTFVLRESVSITTQPKTVSVKKNATAKVTVKASGDGLKYTWYVKNAGAKKYTKSSVTKSTYSVKMTGKVKNRLVYCVVKDKYGKTVKSTTVKLKMK